MNYFIVAAAFGICLLLCMVVNILLYRKYIKMRANQQHVYKEISATRESENIYEKMVPSEMLKLLKVKQYSDLTVGDQQYFSSIIMDVNMADFSGIVHDKQANEVFASINKMLDRIVPIIYEHRGMVEGFEGGGISALFLNEYDEALVASISICEIINEMNSQDKKYESVAVGLCDGSVMIGVVGHEQRMTILTLSEAREFSGFLRSIGHKYYTKIIVTAHFLQQIEDSAKKFNYRLLGYIYIKNTDTLEKLYDVFDGDLMEIRNKKRKTKMVFEKGVELFAKQKWLEARQHFIEVLKMDHMDQAAKEYLLLCDEYFNHEREEHVYIEQY